MWKRFAVFVLALAFPSLSYAFTLSYASSTQIICPINSTLQGTTCYCNTGYTSDGTQCIRDTVASSTPSGNQIYQDIATAVVFNDYKPCSQLGFISATDLDMCNRYEASSDKDSWTFIQRPTATLTAVTNPWAPASQQTLVSANATTTQIVAPYKVPPPPPPPPPAIASTTDDNITKALAKAAAATKAAEAAPPAPTPEPPPPPPPPPPAPEPTPAPEPQPQPQTTQVPMPQIAGAGESLEGMNVMSASPGLSPLSDVQLTPDQTIQDQPKQPSIVAKVFSWLFGWL